MTSGRAAEAAIDLGAVRANAELARRLAGDRDVIAVVKADAYGHGAVPLSRVLLDAGCASLAVASVAEAAELREAHIGSAILVLAGILDEQEAELAVSLGLTPVLHHRESLRLAAAAARRAGTRLPVHVELDTGMRRMGVPADEAAGFLAAVAEEPALELAGAFTHLACADEPNPAFSLEQLARFRSLLRAAREQGVQPGVVHAANSAGLLAGKVLSDALPEATAVRPGLMLYGASSAAHLETAETGETRLRPVMTLRARVVHVREIAAGESVGYGATFRAARRTRIATLPLGYEDGVACAAGNRGGVWLRGARRPIVGRVSMDYVSVDVGDAPVQLGDQAVFFGQGEDGGIPIEEAAREANTIPYELLVRVGRRVPRTYIDTASAPR
jgi:alanine racemase